MNLNSIPGALGGLRVPQDDLRARIDQQRGLRTPAPAAPAAPSAPPRDAGTLSGTAAALPVEAPTGTDPELWSVLSADERTFFAKLGAMGPLTYGRMMMAGQQTPPALRGGRLDVRA